MNSVIVDPSRRAVTVVISSSEGARTTGTSEILIVTTPHVSIDLSPGRSGLPAISNAFDISATRCGYSPID